MKRLTYKIKYFCVLTFLYFSEKVLTKKIHKHIIKLYMNSYSYNQMKRGRNMEENFAECNILHEETVKKVKQKMPEDGFIYDLAELFKVFADSTRMKIIYALLEEELCVCDIANIVGTTQSAISHQLRLLKQSKLVKFRREGKTIFYSLDDEHIQQIVKKGSEHIEEL